MKYRLFLIILLFPLVISFSSSYGDLPSRSESSPKKPFLPERTTSGKPENTARPDEVPEVIKYGYVRGKVYDANDKGLVAARIEISNSKGRLVGGPAKNCPLWVKGSFREKLPVGYYSFKAKKGSFYFENDNPPYIRVEENKEVKLDIPLKPWIPLRKWGWMAFDPYLQTACGREVGEVPSIKHAALIAEAEGLDSVFCAAPWWHDPPPNVDAKTQPEEIALLASRASSDRFKAATSLLHNSRPYYGWFYSIGTQPPTPVTLPDDPCYPNALLMQQLRNSGSLIICSNPSRSLPAKFATSKWAFLEKSTGMFGELFKLKEGYASELPYDLLTGSVDAIDIACEEDMDIWFAALNRGFMVTGLKCGKTQLGSSHEDLPKTLNYAKVRGSFTIPALLKAIKKGNVVVTEGPFIEFAVDSQIPGSVIPADGLDHFTTVKVYAPVDGERTIKRIQLLRNGEIIRNYDSDDSQLSQGEKMAFPREERLMETTDCWYMVKAWDDKGRMSFTNPIYFRVPGTRENTIFPEKITLTLANADASLDPVFKVTEGDRTILVESKKLGKNKFELSSSVGFSARAVFQIVVKEYEPYTFNLFEETVFNRCLRNWSLHKDKNPELSDPLIYNEFRALCAKPELSIQLKPRAQ